MFEILDTLRSHVLWWVVGLFVVFALSLVISIGVELATSKHFRELNATLSDVKSALYDLRCLGEIQSSLGEIQSSLVAIKHSAAELKDISSDITNILRCADELDMSPKYTYFAKMLLEQFEKLNNNVSNLRSD